MISQRILACTLLGAAGVAASAAGAHAQALPTPFDLASGLDLECYRTPGPALNINLDLSHLNPVLQDLPPHQVIVRELAQTCVPVRKNNVWPEPSALPFLRHVDFACYRIEAAPLPNPVPLGLTHLNPVLQGLPQHGVVLEQPAQLCVPVAKNDTLPPPEVLALVRYIDLECYRTDPGPHPQFGLWLSQLNPQLLGIAPHAMALVPEPRQLCVPVRKNAQFIPPAILERVRWIDLEKFKAAPDVKIAPTNITLRHLNPLLVGFPPVPVVLEEATSLLVPVAKNGQIPPKD